MRNIFVDKYAEYSDQHMGAGHSFLSNKDVKFMKICTIILVGTMTIAVKALAMFTLSMGTLTAESVLYSYMVSVAKLVHGTDPSSQEGLKK